MNKDVRINIKGAQSAPDLGDEPEVIELATTGSFYKKNNKYYIKYDEYFEGEDAPVRNLIKFNEEEMEISKKGFINTVMQFRPGKSYIANYVTPHGPIAMGLTTDKYEINEQEKSMELFLSYTIDFNQDYVTDCTLNLTVTEM